jgi:hypothetical protein
VSLERGLLSLGITIEGLLGRNSSGSGQETKNTTIGTRFADHAALSNPQKLALTSPTSGDYSVGIVRSRTQATEFSFLF